MNSDSTSPRRLSVRRVAVLGAGVMGAQIAAHLVNAGVPACCSTCRRRKATRTRVAAQGDRQASRKLEPAPLATQGARAAHRAGQLRRATSSCLRGCDLVIEAIAERMDWKQRPVRARSRRIVAAIAVARLATPRACRSTRWPTALPAELRPRFCGMHFFNPPRYMHLVELIPAADTDPALLDALEAFLTTRSARAWSAPRTRRTSSPTASACSRCWRRCSTPSSSASASTSSTR